MIRQLQTSDQSDFERWTENVPQSISFNWNRQTLLESFHKDLCFGLWEGDLLQAVLCFLKDSSPLEILWLATKPEAQSRGFMKKLLEYGINSASQQMTSGDVAILLEVHEKNLKAINLYTSLGFIEFSRRKNYYKDGAAAVVMLLKSSVI